MKGKVKELFEEWIGKSKEYSKPVHYEKSGLYSIVSSAYLFSYLPPSMQWGVMQDFYGSHGMYLEVSFNSESYWFKIQMYGDGDYSNWRSSTVGDYKTRQEARQEALEKAEEILNDRL